MAAAGSRVGYIFLYGLIVIFALGIIELVILPVVENRLVPTLEAQANLTLPPTMAAQYVTNVNGVVKYLNYMPYIVMFITVVYMVLSIFKREETETYYQP